VEGLVPRIADVEGPDASWAVAVDGGGWVLTRIADVVRVLWAGEDGGKLGLGA